LGGAGAQGQGPLSAKRARDEQVQSTDPRRPFPRAYPNALEAPVTRVPDQGLRVRALADQATAPALEADWPRAVELNAKIIEAAPDDLEARSRLGRALVEQGKLEDAKVSFAEVLKTEPYNSIALRGQARVIALLEHKGKPN